MNDRARLYELSSLTRRYAVNEEDDELELTIENPLEDRVRAYSRLMHLKRVLEAAKRIKKV